MADPFERLPSGIPDEKETSPRQPDALPNYALSVVPTGQIDGNNLGRHFLVIGRLRKTGTAARWTGTSSLPVPACPAIRT